jgi:hypothetical protein
MREIPHPLVGETAARLAQTPRRGTAEEGAPRAGRAGPDVRLIHLNHTNRLLWDVPARRALRERGLGVARDGDELPL